MDAKHGERRWPGGVFCEWEQFHHHASRRTAEKAHVRLPRLLTSLRELRALEQGPLTVPRRVGREPTECPAQRRLASLCEIGVLARLRLSRDALGKNLLPSPVGLLSEFSFLWLQGWHLPWLAGRQRPLSDPRGHTRALPDGPFHPGVSDRELKHLVSFTSNLFFKRNSIPFKSSADLTRPSKNHLFFLKPAVPSKRSESQERYLCSSQVPVLRGKPASPE